MMKTGLFSVYQRLLFTSHVKSDLTVSARCFSLNRVLPCSDRRLPASEQHSDPSKGSTEPKQIEKEEMKISDLSGDTLDRPKIIHPKVTARPLNFEEARELALKTMGQ